MDRRQFLTLTAGLSAIATGSVEAALSLDEVKSGLAVNKKGQKISSGIDFIELEKEITQNFKQQFFSGEGLKVFNKAVFPYRDKLAQDALQSIYLPLSQSSTRKDLEWQVFLVDDEVANGFTGGGGLTFINTGAVKISKTETELAAILAHEIGHIEHKHKIRSLMSFNILNEIGLNNNYALIDEVDRLKQHGVDIPLSVMMKISLEIFYRNYTRMWEHQADAFILRAFVDTGYDVNLASAYGRTQLRKYKNKPPLKGTCLYSTHPARVERVNRIEAIAKTLTNNSRPRGDSDAFRYLKDRIGHEEV